MLKNSPLLRAALLALLVASSFSTTVLAGNCARDLTSWKPIQTVRNLPPNAIAVAASPTTGNFLAVASDNSGNRDYSFYTLDRTQLHQGWNKTGTLSGFDVYDLIATANNFVVTGRNPDMEYQPFIAVGSEDGSNWEVKDAALVNVPFIGVGSNDSMAIFSLSQNNDASDFVAIGSESFGPNASQARIRHAFHRSLHGRISSVAANDEIFVAIASDGTSYSSPASKH